MAGNPGGSKVGEHKTNPKPFVGHMGNFVPGSDASVAIAVMCGRCIALASTSSQHELVEGIAILGIWPRRGTDASESSYEF